MARLSEEQVEELVGILSDTLNRDNIQVYLGLATGDRLYDEYDVGINSGKNKILRTLVTALDEQGTLIQFLRVVYERRPHRDDVRLYLRERFPGSDMPMRRGI